MGQRALAHCPAAELLRQLHRQRLVRILSPKSAKQCSRKIVGNSRHMARRQVAPIAMVASVTMRRTSCHSAVAGSRPKVVKWTSNIGVWTSMCRQFRPRCHRLQHQAPNHLQSRRRLQCHRRRQLLQAVLVDHLVLVSNCALSPQMQSTHLV